jgi:hypothetical protein
MKDIYTAVLAVLFVNAMISFFIAFFWQAKMIFLLLNTPDPRLSFSLFQAGEIHPELRRKWGKAVAYVAVSYVLLFAVGITLQNFEPTLFDSAP